MKRLAAALLLVLATTPAAVAQQAPSLKERADALAKPYIESGLVVGMSVGLYREGETTVLSYGRLSAGSETAPDGNTVYEIGSITKVFTCILLAKMVAEGMVTLEQPIRTLLPEGTSVPKRGDAEITLLDLATHHSGLPRMPSNFKPADPTNPYADYYAKHLYEWLATAKAGEAKHSYSNVGMGLLGHALTLRQRQSYERMLFARILGPLGMKSTRIAFTADMRGRLAPGHDADGAPAANWDLAVLAPAGGIRSTVNDMLLFLAANIEEDDSPLGRAMGEARKPRRSTPRGKVGLGWHQGDEDGKTVRHNGGTGGYHSMLALRPKEGVGVVVLANSSTGQVDRFAGQLLRLLLGKVVTPTTIRMPMAVASDILQEYVGTYRLSPMHLFTITRKGDKLFAQLTGQGTFRIYPESKTKFFYRVAPAAITFTRNEKGKVTGLTLIQGGKDHPAKRE